MSGTSLDGVDAAVLETDGQTVQGFGPSLTLPYPPALRARLREVIAQAAAPETGVVGCEQPTLREVEAELTGWHAEAVRQLGVGAALIGFHGQTILHAPERRVTRQIGDAAWLAEATRTPVACDFRLADVAAGGQGAPFAPLYHAALAAGLEKPVLIVNIGGVANLTWIGGGPDEILACDTGPGNALLDDFMLARTGTPVDTDGAAARRGAVQMPILQAWIADPFFSLAAPKSLDRQHFSGTLDALKGVSTDDGAATLVAFTAAAIARTLLPCPPKRVMVTGGGRHNAAIMAALADAMGMSVEPVEAAGWDGDALEAQCFGFLAARVLHGLPLSLPGTTGVPAPMPGGRIAYP
jgi:anhydro-N-acetylmuramic acid kinase